MKRKWLIFILAVFPAAFLPLPAGGQVAPDRAPRPDTGEPVYKYQVYGGFAYTSLNQVNQGFSATATGVGSMQGFSFDIDQDSKHATSLFTGAAVPANCWMVQADRCV